jgi:hypothetical protein
MRPNRSARSRSNAALPRIRGHPQLPGNGSPADRETAGRLAGTLNAAGNKKARDFPGPSYFLGSRAIKNTGVPLIIAFIGRKLKIKDLTLKVPAYLSFTRSLMVNNDIITDTATRKNKNRP